MTTTIEAGFDLDVIGDVTIRITEAAGPLSFNVSLGTGKYCHSSLAGVAPYAAFGDDLATAMTTASAASGNVWTYTCIWSASLGQYVGINASGGNIALQFSSFGGGIPDENGTRMRQILGFDGNQSSAASHTSTVVPFYYINAAGDAVTDPTDDYEADGFIEDAYTANGNHYSMSSGVLPTWSDFELWSESYAASFSRWAPDGETPADVPWTYEHLVKHVRGVEPFLIQTDIENTVHRMRESAARFKPIRRIRNNNLLWNHRFETVVLGRLAPPE